MSKKQIGKAAGLLLIFLISVLYLTNILVSKWKKPCFETRVQKEFYKLDKNSVEVCLMGSSQVVYGISAMELMDNYGISAYSFGSAKQPLIATLAWLKESRKTQNINTVVLDTSMLFENTEEARYHVAFDNMKLSLNKIQAIYEHCKQRDSADPFLSFFIKIIKYHSRWSELTENDFTYDSQDLPIFRGNVVTAHTTEMEYYDIAYDHDKFNEDLEMQDYQLEYFLKLVEYCREEGLNLLLIKTPKDDWSLTKHELTAALAEELGLTFIDFSSEAMIEELGIDVSTDFYDGEHVNLFGSRKLTAYIGQYLKEHYDLTDFREVEGYVNPNYERYTEYVKDCELQVCTNSSDYFEALKDDRYEVLLQVTSELSGKYEKELLEALAECGIRSNLNELHGLRFAAHFTDGTNLYEDTSQKSMTYKGSFSDGTAFSMASDIKKSGKSTITVAGTKYTFSKRGLNILVYDSRNGRIVDGATLCTDSSGENLVLVNDGN